MSIKKTSFIIILIIALIFIAIKIYNNYIDHKCELKITIKNNENIQFTSYYKSITPDSICICIKDDDYTVTIRK